MKWLHKWLHPHCADCREEKEQEIERERESRVCHSCEMLRLQNAQLVEERDKLLDRLLSTPIQVETPQQSAQTLKPISPGRFVSFNMKRQMLEAEDRHRATLLNEKEKELSTFKDKTAKLEAELGIGDKNAIPNSNA